MRIRFTLFLVLSFPSLSAMLEFTMNNSLEPHQDEESTSSEVQSHALSVRDLTGQEVAKALRPSAKRGLLTASVEYQRPSWVVHLRLPYGTREQLQSYMMTPLPGGETIWQKALSLYIESWRSRDVWKRFAQNENVDYDLVQRRGFLIPVDWRNFRKGFTDKESPEDLREIAHIFWLEKIFHDYLSLIPLPLVTREQIRSRRVRKYIKEWLRGLSKVGGPTFIEALGIVLSEWNTEKKPTLRGKTYAEHSGWKMPSVIVRGWPILPTHLIGILWITDSTKKSILGSLGIRGHIWKDNVGKRANGPSFDTDDYLLAWEETDIGRHYIALRMSGMTGTKAFDLSLKRWNDVYSKKYGYTLSPTSPKAALARTALKDQMNLCQRILENDYHEYMRRFLAKMIGTYLLRNDGSEVSESDILYHTSSATYRFSSGFLTRFSEWKLPRHITLEYLQSLLETEKSQEDDAIQNLTQKLIKKE